jgi:hypothetical protein
MSDYSTIEELSEQLEVLKNKQEVFQNEIESIRLAIQKIKGLEAEVSEPIITKEPLAPIYTQDTPEPYQTIEILKVQKAKRSNLEKFIGENLISKIGIIITVLGVSMGAKYSIEHNLISPVVRILLGYFAGAGLLFTAYKLKSKYENYSAVLASGAMAVFFFITFSAYGFYELIPQTLAFIIMTIITAFTVVIAVNYNQQIIALFGMIGAYAIPFLLSNNSGNYVFLFSYMLIINGGLLAIAIKRYWKPVMHSSIGISWLIFFGWCLGKYQSEQDISMALCFGLLFYLVFYTSIIIHKLRHTLKFKSPDIALLIVNGLIFYGIGYKLINEHPQGDDYLGLFTVFNAAIHFAAALFIVKKVKADVLLFRFICGLVLLFLTLFVPVQFNGSSVTVLWLGLGSVLLVVGRVYNESFYERMSYPMIGIATLSLMDDWRYLNNIRHGNQDSGTPFAHWGFFINLFFTAVVGFLVSIRLKWKIIQPIFKDEILNFTAKYGLPFLLVAIGYFTFRFEIGNYWELTYLDSLATITDGQMINGQFYNGDLIEMRRMWLINYSILYFGLVSLVVLKNFYSDNRAKLFLVLNGVVGFMFFTVGLYALSELRESYLAPSYPEIFDYSSFNVWFRYISFLFLAFNLYCQHQLYSKLNSASLIKYKNIALFTTALWIGSSELLHWMDLAGYANSYKLALSIWYGIFSLGFISLGIWKAIKEWRILSMFLFGATLVKLFVYDIAHLGTMSKTVVFVSLGVLLLVISYLYNRFKEKLDLQ